MLAGQAFDDRARALTGSRLRWRLGRCSLGTGEQISAAGLPAGRRRIDLVARESAGRTSRASVVVVVSAARPRLKVASSLPARLVVRAAGLRTQRFTVSRTQRRLTLRIRRGAKPLELRLALTTGARSSAARLSVTRL